MGYCTKSLILMLFAIVTATGCSRPHVPVAIWLVPAQPERRQIEEATLSLYRHEKPTDPGTKLTIDTAKALGRPLLICDMTDDHQVDRVLEWIQWYEVKTLNVGGPAEGKGRIGATAERFLFKMFSQMQSVAVHRGDRFNLRYSGP
jgi:Circularly permutated YpsA SLOG family